MKKPDFSLIETTNLFDSAMSFLIFATDWRLK